MNRKIGTLFERQPCTGPAGYGFWAHQVAQNGQGQPFDVIATKNGHTYPIGCKVHEKDIFRLEWAERNQYSAMTFWWQMGNGESRFVLRVTNGEAWFISFEATGRTMLTRRSLYRSEIKQLGTTLEEWVSKYR